MKIMPIGTRILVKPDKEDEVSKGGIFIPLQARERMAAESVRGTVVEVGEFAWIELKEKLVQKGDRVIFAKWGGLVVKDDDGGEDYRLLNDEDVLAIVIK